MGESYITFEPNNNGRTVRRVGKDIVTDRINAGSEYNEYARNRAKINVLVFPINQQDKGKLSCTVCGQRCEVMNKAQIISTYDNIKDAEAVQITIQK